MGVAEYQLTANVWIRGILAERHGLAVDAVRYRTGGQHAPGRVAKLAHAAPAGVEIEPIPAGATLAGMLADGELDALYTPRVPHGFGEGRVRRLFADARAEEERYFAETGIFPVMHVVVLRRDVYERRPVAGAVPVQGVRAGQTGRGRADRGDGGAAPRCCPGGTPRRSGPGA